MAKKKTCPTCNEVHDPKFSCLQGWLRRIGRRGIAQRLHELAETKRGRGGDEYLLELDDEIDRKRGISSGPHQSRAKEEDIQDS